MRAWASSQSLRRLSRPDTSPRRASQVGDERQSRLDRLAEAAHLRIPSRPLIRYGFIVARWILGASSLVGSERNVEMVLAGQPVPGGVGQHPPHDAFQCLLNEEIVTHEIRRHREALDFWNREDGDWPPCDSEPAWW